MSVHYSKYLLNTYAATPYFQAQIPADYPLDRVLIQSRAFHRLPPHLQELAGLAKGWACRSNPEKPGGIDGIERWYDAEGYELNPATGQRLTDAEIDAQWPPDAQTVAVADIPLPPGGFADPSTWEPTESTEEAEEEGLTEAQLLKDIASHGREYTARYYGVPTGQLASDQDLVRAILGMHGGVPAEPVPFDRESHKTQHRHQDGTFGPTLTDAEIDALSSKAIEEGVKELPDAKLDELIAKAREEKRRREQDPLEYD